MKSFKQYARQAADRPDEATAERTENHSPAAEQLARQIASSYHGKSDGAMWKKILAEAEKSRRAGTLSDADIENFYRQFSPMLDGEKRRRLRAVLDKLKET